MSTIRQIDFLLVDEIFDMGSGYVLTFSDRTFAQFFATELNVDIDDPKYFKCGSSKAKRLRYFLQMVDTATAVKTLKALWEYRQAIRASIAQPDKLPNAQGRLLELIRRLQGKTKSELDPGQPTFNWSTISALRAQLTELAQFKPQERGYKFEIFLKLLFDNFGLKAREAFRLRGEQIDGSFELGNETYLLEAKWHNDRTGVADLHVFHGKLEQKAVWARGLFVSYSGFTTDGLSAFGRGKRVVCMDGLDIYNCLEQELPLTRVLESKVRRAAETGNPFVPVTDLFPAQR